MTDMIGGFIHNVIADVLGWTLVCIAFAWMTARVFHGHGGRQPSRIAVMNILFLAVIAVMPAGAQTSGTTDPQATSSSRPLQQQERYVEIVKAVLQSPDSLTPAVHGEFWAIADSWALSPAQMSEMRERMTGLLTLYQPLFWQDVLKTLETGQPQKSTQRADLEKRLISQGAMSKKRTETNDALMVKIAAKEPIAIGGQSTVINEELARSVLAGIQERARGIDKLFTRPQK